MAAVTSKAVTVDFTVMGLGIDEASGDVVANFVRTEKLVESEVGKALDGDHGPQVTMMFPGGGKMNLGPEPRSLEERHKWGTGWRMTRDEYEQMGSPPLYARVVISVSQQPYARASLRQS